MKNQLLHTPEGVRDIYGEECERKLELQSRLYKALGKFGYHSIQTPTFEFFDVFSREIGTTPSKELYKFFDREGNTLVLRPDITPSIARAAAKYYTDEDMPIRLRYQGSVFINNSSYQGRLKECTQLGAELIGDDSVDADAEMITMTIEALRNCELKEFQISVGHVEFLQGLVEAANLNEEEAQTIRELIVNKNFFGVAEEIAKYSLPEELTQLFGMLGKLYDRTADFSAAGALAANYSKVLCAIRRLEQLDEILQEHEVASYVSYDLGMLTDYHYYTGVIFAGYTYGTGEPIVRGGRYDNLLEHFGKKAPSIGFAFAVDQIMTAISRQGLQTATESTSSYL
ncbi:MAG: ATP phosphoribosyltransferase regulatory subunit [Lachnospiraceae bacterium]|nr:ATP phosphoribosyltransferase regulatory subunit [Lachnospiraceae bacterium]